MNTQMQMPERVQVDESSTLFNGRFILQPLERGYGVTIGNSLRRVLLSSIQGYAIIGIKITDVLHEFQTIPGVVEDMTDIILNLKEVKIKSDELKPFKVNFHISGPHVWTAKDIQNGSDDLIEVIEPNHYIATIAEDTEFDVELRIGRGKGYVPSEELQLVDYPIGMLPIDAIYTPIVNVLYQIEPYRVGNKIDFEKLSLDVKTDGTVSAQEALHFAAKVMNEHIKFFTSFEDQIEEEKRMVVAEEEVKVAEKTRIKKILTTPVDELELSVRAHNCLKAANITHLWQLVILEESELLKFRNFGRKSLAELIQVVQDHSLEFGMNVEHYLREDKTPVV
ncbi:MAG: DNA-directed RNA polymerase subunit alpha [Candidatus Kapabacteria bacterium]|nr:DNA-directed RNA polymerase subunit alpha [Candidatus Kapabacteria bacterium]